NRNPFGLTIFLDACRSARSRRARLRHHGRRRDAEQQASRPASNIRNGLLLVPLVGRRIGDCSFGNTVGRGLSLVHPRGAFFRGGNRRPHGSPATVAKLGSTAHHRYGHIVHLVTSRLLC